MRTVFRCCILLASVLVLLATVDLLQASYVVTVDLQRYLNPSHEKDNELCCDGRTACMASCNNQFGICLRTLRQNSENCTLGEHWSGFIDSDSITFSQQSIITNPITLEVNAPWTGEVEMLLEVHDELSADEPESSLVFTALVAIRISHNPAVNRISTTGTILLYRQDKFLSLSVDLECSENFYGPDCGVKCVGRNDILGHFHCDENGTMVCLDGFNNASTNCTECLLSDGCCAFCNSTHHCICKEEFSGEFCEFDLNVCRTMEERCGNGGTCVYNETAQNGFSCSCLEGYGCSTCELDLDVCNHISPCQNNGSCENGGPDNYTCRCSAGFEGRNCTMETNEYTQNMCLNGAICKDLHLDYECVCGPDFDGRFCEIELDGCVGQICYNNGTCHNNYGDFICVCPSGYVGRNCEVQVLLWAIGGSVATGLLLIMVICLLAALVCVIGQRKKLSIEEASNPTTSLQQAEFNASTHSRKSCFDDPAYNDVGNRVPNDGHYFHLKSRMGKASKNQATVLGPASSSVVDLLNSLGDYSTLEDSVRSEYATRNLAKKYEHLQRMGSTTVISHPPQRIYESSDEEYAQLDLMSSQTTPTMDSRQELATSNVPGLPHPYETVSSHNSSTSIAATVEAQYDNLAVRSSSALGEVTEVSPTESGHHDFESLPGGGLYESTEEMNLYDEPCVDLTAATETLYNNIDL